MAFPARGRYDEFMPRVAVLVLDGVFDSGLSVVVDTFATASSLAERRSSRFDVTLCGLRRSAKTRHGFGVSLAPAKGKPDIVVVPALGCMSREALLERLDRSDVRDACEVLGAWSKSGARLAGACTATFVMGQAGVLDDARATTTWWLSPVFREKFPRVDLDESKMIVDAGRVVTAGAALAHVDLALYLVRKTSPALAEATARYLVYDTRPSQAAFVMPDHVAHTDPLVERFEAWARRHLASFTMAAAARGVGASERTLQRRIQTVLGRSPLSYVRDLRVEVATHRLRTTKDSIEEIAAAVGYGDGVTLRTLLREKTGRGVRELRAH
jgi:transcriptional regulator GlxA family with amidase domain